MQEQRQHVRVAAPILVQFPNPATMKTERSFTQDVSETGMRFPTPVRLDVGQQVPMTLNVPFNETTLHTTGEIVWVREIARLGAPQYEVGVRFRWIEDPDRHLFARHLAGFRPGGV
jgi:hypothetical protein